MGRGGKSAAGVEQINRESDGDFAYCGHFLGCQKSAAADFPHMMNRKTKGLLVIGFCIVLAGGYWWLESSTRPPAGATPDEPGRLSPVTRSVPSVSGTFTAPVVKEAAPQTEQPENTLPSVGDILAEPDEDYVRVAKKLSAIVLNPNAPIAEREEALAHALNLSAGNEAEVLTPLVKDKNLPDSLAETVLSEALNRPLAYQADLYLVALAARKSPEMQKTIREHLAFLTGGDDKGENPADWTEAIKAAKASWPE